VVKNLDLALLQEV